MHGRSRKLTIVAAILAVLIAAWFVKHQRDRREAAKREARYQSILHEYALELKPGMTRDRVEEFLKTNGKPFKQMCCVANFHGEHVSFTTSGYDDLVKIGEESVPFVCSENNVYMAFEFNPKSTGERPKTNDSDTLKRVSVFHFLEGCL
jgi:hypothetical protein